MVTAMYRCEALSIEGFIQHLAVCYVGRGYFFYVTSQVPEHKDPRAVDAKLIRQYNIGVSKWSKWRGYHQSGAAKLQYLRHERFFVLLATHGHHDCQRREAHCIRDARKIPIKFAGYSVSVRGGHAHVRIELEAYKWLKAYCVERVHKQKATLEAAFYRLPYEPYKPVRQQLLTILRAVNRARVASGLEALADSCIRYRRRIVRPFDAAGKGMEEAA